MGQFHSVERSNMKTINQVYFNLPGIAWLYAVPISEITRPLHTYKDYAEWSKLIEASIRIPVYPDDSFVFNEDQSLEDGGMLWSTTIEGIIPRQVTDELSAHYVSICMLERGEWAVILCDRNGDIKMAGTAEVPMSFTAKNTTGSSSTRNGRSFSFSAKNAEPSLNLSPMP